MLVRVDLRSTAVRGILLAKNSTQRAARFSWSRFGLVLVVN
jgi:hypothetical protein